MWTFGILEQWFCPIFKQVISIRVQTLSNTNFVTSRDIKREKTYHFWLTYVAQKLVLLISSLMMSKPKTFALFQCFLVHHSDSVYGHMHVLAECTVFLKQLSSERKYRAAFHVWRNDKRFCPPLKCICNLYKIGMHVEVWSTLFMKDSFATISVFIMAWPAGKEFVLGIHVIDPLLTNPLRSIWLNVGPKQILFLQARPL